MNQTDESFWTSGETALEKLLDNCQSISSSTEAIIDESDEATLSSEEASSVHQEQNQNNLSVKSVVKILTTPLVKCELIDDVPDGYSVNGFPVFSLIALAALAIEGSPDKGPSFDEICDTIMKKYPYYKKNEKALRQQMGHNLKFYNNRLFTEVFLYDDDYEKLNNFWTIRSDIDELLICPKTGILRVKFSSESYEYLDDVNGPFGGPSPILDFSKSSVVPQMFVKSESSGEPQTLILKSKDPLHPVPSTSTKFQTYSQPDCQVVPKSQIYRRIKTYQQHEASPYQTPKEQFPLVCPQSQMYKIDPFRPVPVLTQGYSDPQSKAYLQSEACSPSELNSESTSSEGTVSDSEFSIYFPSGI